MERVMRMLSRERGGGGLVRSSGGSGGRQGREVRCRVWSGVSYCLRERERRERGFGDSSHSPQTVRVQSRVEKYDAVQRSYSSRS
jgi:hypothetical protein